MCFFCKWRKCKGTTTAEKMQARENAASHNAAIEIVAHKEARAEVIAEVKRENERLSLLLSQNGFTVKLYMAAGGVHPFENTDNIIAKNTIRNKKRGEK